MESPSPIINDVCDRMRKQSKEQVANMDIGQTDTKPKTAAQEAIDRLIPEAYTGATIDTLPPVLAKKLLSKPNRQGVYIWGGDGTGKTHATMAMMRKYITDGKSVIRKKHKALLLEIRECYSSQQSEQSVIMKHTRPDILVIDDLNSSVGCTDFASDIPLHIIDDRMEYHRPTIITGNLSPEALGKMGSRLGSRLKTFLIIKLGGDDKRGQKGGEWK